MDYYIDGSCKGNPGVGGWAVIAVKDNTLYDQVGSFVEPPVTNNMMEVCALIHCMCYIMSDYKDNSPVIYTDSMYNINCYKHCDAWLKKVNLKNSPYVRAVSYLKRSLERHGYHVVIKKVEGHSGDRWNEEADKLASLCAFKQAKSYYTKKIFSKVSKQITSCKYDQKKFYENLIKVGKNSE